MKSDQISSSYNNREISRKSKPPPNLTRTKIATRARQDECLDRMNVLLRGLNATGLASLFIFFQS